MLASLEAGMNSPNLPWHVNITSLKHRSRFGEVPCFRHIIHRPKSRLVRFFFRYITVPLRFEICRWKQFSLDKQISSLVVCSISFRHIIHRPKSRLVRFFFRYITVPLRLEICRWKQFSLDKQISSLVVCSIISISHVFDDNRLELRAE